MSRDGDGLAVQESIEHIGAIIETLTQESRSLLNDVGPDSSLRERVDTIQDKTKELSSLFRKLADEL